MYDHVHMCLSIPSKYSISHAIGFLKGKSAIMIHRGHFRNMKDGKSFWARGYFVSTVGLDEKTIRTYIKKQEQSEQRQLEFETEIN